MFFGVPEADDLIGSDPKGGQIVEISGPSQCGKTYLALKACAQKELPLWIDLDGTFPYVYAKKLDLVDKIIIFNQFDQIVTAVSQLLDSTHPDIIIVDPTHAIDIRKRMELYRLLFFHAPRLNIPVILVSSGTDQNRVSSMAAIRIEMAPVRYKGNKVIYLMRTIKNINAPAWKEASFAKDIE